MSLLRRNVWLWLHTLNKHANFFICVWCEQRTKKFTTNGDVDIVDRVVGFGWFLFDAVCAHWSVGVSLATS